MQFREERMPSMWKEPRIPSTVKREKAHCDGRRLCNPRTQETKAG